MVGILVVAAWVWSYFVGAEFIIQMAPRSVGQESVAYFISQDGGRIELVVNSPPGIYASWPVTTVGFFFPEGPSVIFRGSRWRFGGFDVGTFRYPNPDRVAVIRGVAIPHWFVLMLLALVSYWSRRRQRSRMRRGFQVEDTAPNSPDGPVTTKA